MEFRNMTLRYGEKLILNHFSLSVPATGVLCLFGPSGCGKTTLLRVLGGLEILESGEMPDGLRVGMVFQENRLLPWMTVAGNLTAVAGISREQAEEWLQKVGLSQEAHCRPGALSGGMQRRVAMARALATESGLLLLDEPFTGVDGETKKLLYPLILEAAEQKPVILVTHHLDEAQALGAKVIQLEGPPLGIL